MGICFNSPVFLSSDGTGHFAFPPFVENRRKDDLTLHGFMGYLAIVVTTTKQTKKSAQVSSVGW